MKEEKLLKNQNGITLIALVITIIVMLILAGVTINLTLGDNGIFTTAQQAAKNYTDAQNKELSYLQGFTNEVDNIVNPAPLGTIIKTENGINYTADGVGNAIPVPLGFVPITTAEGQGTKDTGFVIRNTTDENEFVWVPVANVENYTRIAWSRKDWENKQRIEGIDETTMSSKITRGTLIYHWTEKKSEDEFTSVSKYGGYYIGRYESGIKNGTLTSNSNSGIIEETEKKNWTGWTGEKIELVVQYDQKVWNYITRDKAIEVSKKLYNKAEDKVISKLCSSYAWDTALKFIETQNKDYPVNSRGGNYSIETGGKGSINRTGYHSVNNIYDMGGNTWEWTTEFYSNPDKPCVCRGGDFYSSASKVPVAHRAGDSQVTANGLVSFRITLFIK